MEIDSYRCAAGDDSCRMDEHPDGGLMRHITGVLAIGAHPDDIELGCGGSLAKLAAEGVKVHALVLSCGDRGNIHGHDRCAESAEALGMLGVSTVLQAEFADTQLAGSFGDIVELIERECSRLTPDRVYTMFKEDRHQDHRTAFEASIVACRKVPQVLCYETPSSWPNFVPQIFEDVSGYLDKKIDALKRHVSQEDRYYMQKGEIACLARFRGQQVAAGPSEGFIPYKLVL
jgi:LmbE family N-acetylglucosaminyl deacetylase